jgi:pheromone shutdown protein TraB
VGHACELRLRALARGGALHLDDHLAALRRFQPATFRVSVEERDAHMAAQLGALLGSLGAARGAARELRDEPAEVLVLCGAAHLPGLHARLSREGWCSSAAESRSDAS